MLEEAVGEVVPDVGVEVEPALFPELHSADPYHSLGDASPLEYGVLVAGNMVLAVGLAEVALIEDIVALKYYRLEARIVFDARLKIELLVEFVRNTAVFHARGKPLLLLSRSRRGESCSCRKQCG